MEVITALAILAAVCVILGALLVGLVVAVDDAIWRMDRRRVRQRRRGGFLL